MRVLLSIKPEHAFNILNGVKRYEYRRRLFSRKDIKTVVIYCTMPVGKIIGEFDIEQVICDEPESLWTRTSCHAGITYCYFSRYFEGREVANALQIGEVRKYEEQIDPKSVMADFTPPQSYMYVIGEGEDISRPGKTYDLL